VIDILDSNDTLIHKRSVAEIVEKPLYRVTCGDIGTNAEDVEKVYEQS